MPPVGDENSHHLMDPVLDKIARLTAYQSNLNRRVIDQVRRNEAEVLRLNTEDQLFERGVDNQGEAVRPAYTANTVAYKRRKGQPTDRVTLKDTGAFHRSFFVLYEADEFTLYADDTKAPKLFKKYGNNVIGLTEQSIGHLAERIRPDLIEDLRKELDV